MCLYKYLVNMQKGEELTMYIKFQTATVLMF